MLDPLYMENSREKIKKFYLNDLNYNKNSIKMRYRKLKIINRIHRKRKKKNKNKKSSSKNFIFNKWF